MSERNGMTPDQFRGAIPIGAASLQEQAMHAVNLRLQRPWPDTPRLVEEVFTIAGHGMKLDIPQDQIDALVETVYWSIRARLSSMGVPFEAGRFVIEAGQIGSTPDGRPAAQFYLRWRPREEQAGGASPVKPTLVVD